MEKKSKVIILLLCIAMALSFNAMIVDAKITLGKQCDFNLINNGIDSILTDVNANPQYTQFVEDSGYKVVRLVVDKTNEYYFMYNKDSKQVEKVDAIDPDFSIKVTCRQITTVIKDYNSDSPKLNRAILNRIPMKVKSKLINQCFETDWCMKKILGK